MSRYAVIAALCVCCTAVASGMMMAPTMAPMMGPMMQPMPMSDAAMKYNVTLLPQNQVPGVPNSGALGYAILKFMPDTSTIYYKLVVSNIYSPIAAHIHGGAPNANGPVIAVLYSPATPVNSATAMFGKLANGTLTPANFTGPAKGLSFSEFVDKYVKTGNSYVNVHTTQNPDGLIRGQVDSMAMQMYTPMAPMMGPMPMPMPMMPEPMAMAPMAMPMAPMPMPMAPMAMPMPPMPMPGMKTATAGRRMLSA
ncbi:hypothetical protein COCOBI_11-0310 [Coccomyxa sp. Obi]|nr:hypothetical protein COCOBI_11-0310 [Coccomyxa sp. Obi]